MRDVAELMELASARPDVRVQPEEYVRLLGYPRGWVLEGRARELADWAGDWYAKNGRPWIYARQAKDFAIREGSGGESGADSIEIDGIPFTSKRLRNTLKKAEAHDVILVAVGAGPEAEEESRRRWEEEKPDEYFFLEIYASAVVEHLVTAAGARLCDWAERQEMAVLPHYSPGYAEWDVAEQPRLLALLKQTRKEEFPSGVEVFDTGMLRPKKTLLAVFGLTRHTEQLRRLTDLVPCENCSFGSCQYRRAAYRRASRSWGEELATPFVVLDPEAKYSVNRRALKRWAEERLSMSLREDGSLEATFRYEGTTCTNMGRSLAFDYGVTLGPRTAGYPILEQHCVPAADDTGHTRMCQYMENPERLMSAIDSEKPLSGEQLNSVLSWRRSGSAAGCYCEAGSRDHKWGLVLETIHYALAEKEQAQDTETS